MTENNLNDLTTIWNYLTIDEEIKKADCIMALGCSDKNVAVRAAELYLEGFGEYIIFSGGKGWITKNIFQNPEAVYFASIAMDMGVPEDRILLETDSENTGDNIKKTKAMLSNLGIEFQTMIVVGKPYALRRIASSFRKQWPEIQFTVSSEAISCKDYLERYRTNRQEVDLKTVITMITGEITRLQSYVAEGYIESSCIPEEVMDAYMRLVARDIS